MAELSYFWDNPGTGDAPAGGYGNEEMREVLRMIFNGTGNQGVLLGWLDELEVTDGGGLNADVASGAAFAYGMWFESDDSETVALANNAAQTVIVRASWAAQTARLAVTSVALVQNPGATYEIPLATLTTAGGAITVGPTDARDYCEFATDMQSGVVITSSIQDDAVTIAKLENQTRWVSRAYGQLEADGTNPATLASFGQYS